MDSELVQQMLEDPVTLCIQYKDSINACDTSDYSLSSSSGKTIAMILIAWDSWLFLVPNDYMCVEATAYVPKKHRAEGVDITGIARYLAAMRA